MPHRTQIGRLQAAFAGPRHRVGGERRRPRYLKRAGRRAQLHPPYALHRVRHTNVHIIFTHVRERDASQRRMLIVVHIHKVKLGRHAPQHQTVADRHHIIIIVVAHNLTHAVDWRRHQRHRLSHACRVEEKEPSRSPTLCDRQRLQSTTVLTPPSADEA